MAPATASTRAESPLSSLRARLFLTVGIVLAASIVASSLLSRRATLVEVRSVVIGPVRIEAAGLDAAAMQVEETVRATGLSKSRELEATLAAAARSSGHPLLLVDTVPRVVGGSTAILSAASLRRADAEGNLSLEVLKGGRLSTMELRGAPVRPIRDQHGQRAGYLYVLPGGENDRPLSPGVIPPPWVLATAAIALIALVLTFTLSRRILQPVSALTAAAERMKAGDLDVRVDARGGDEIAALSRAFNAMAERISDTERLRRQMVTDVAHELRSPVTNLRCSLEAIQDGLALADKASIDTLHDETLFLQRLIGDLQDLALADAGRLELQRDTVDVEAVVRAAAASLASVRDAAAIEVTADQHVPAVIGDADRLEQVFRNLLINARTHTPVEGSIAITVAREGTGVQIEVRDTGRGIGAGDLAHVFDRFYRADRSRARATGGAGLGLAIARHLVTAHGGSITASSAGLGKGATFVVNLPRTGSRVTA